MPKKKYRVALSAEERTTLEQLLRRGKAGTRKLTRARILLKADEGLRDEEIATALHVGTATVGRTRQRFVEENLGALDEHARPGAQRKLTGKQEAHERVPIVAALRLRVGVGAEMQRQLAIDDAEVRDVARIREEDWIERRFEVARAESIAVQFVFVGVRECRITGIAERV